jgi:hypothetical protein
MADFNVTTPDETIETKKHLIEIWLKPCAGKVVIVNSPINNKARGI